MWIGVLNFVMTRPYCLSCGNVPIPEFYGCTVEQPQSSRARLCLQHPRVIFLTTQCIWDVRLITGLNTVNSLSPLQNMSKLSYWSLIQTLLHQHSKTQRSVVSALNTPSTSNGLGSSTSPPGSMIETSVFLCLLWP